ncbi:MAG: O-antigen ligase family protein [Patescibacteria group bacterium]|jgi:O-antigen ligase
MKKVTLPNILSGLVLAIFFFLPFERIPTFDVGGFTVKISYLLAIAFLSCWLFGLLFRKDKFVKFRGSEVILVGLFISDLISFMLAPTKRGLIFTLLWLFMFLIYFSFSRVIAKISFEKIEKFLIAAAIFISIFGLVQFLGDTFDAPTTFTGLLQRYTKEVFGFARIQSVALEPLYFANFLIIPILISLRKYIFGAKFFNSTFWLIVLFLVNFLLTMSRGAFLGMGVALLIFLIYIICNKTIANRFAKIGGGIVAFILSLGICFGLIWLNQMVRDIKNPPKDGQKVQLTSSFLQQTTNVVPSQRSDYSTFERLGFYGSAIDSFKKKPIFGAGPASFGYLYTPAAQLANGQYLIVNNEYLELLAENGAVGLTLFLLFLVFLAIEIRKATRSLPLAQKSTVIALSLGMLAVLIQYNFFSTLYVISFWVFLAWLNSYQFKQNEK